MAVADPRALLSRLLKEPAETPWLEWKHNNCNPEEIGRYISACANAAILAERDRAYIVFGIENKTKKKLGTAVQLHNMKKGNENLSNWLMRMISPRLMMEFLDFEDEGKAFSILAIEPTYDRPVRFGDTEYIRIGENIRALKDFQEYERALWLATSKRKFENAIALPHQTTDQVLEKLDTNVYYEMSQQPKPKNVNEIIHRMEHEGFIKEDMEGTYDINNLGAIVLARDISHFPSISSKSVRVIKYVGKDKQKSEIEIEGRKGYAVGFPGLMGFIMNRLPTNEIYVGGVRRNTPIYPETAIREIIANALIHQDFTISGVGPVIEIYDDRVEVSNPGNSLVDVDRIIDERRSRNEKLAGTMRMLGLCEERGGGIDKAIIQIEEMSLPAPWFFLSENSMRVVQFGPKKFNELSKADKVWACFCHCVVRFIRQDYMSNATLRNRFSLPETEYQAISSVISYARKEGRIVPADENQGNKYAKYVPYWAR